MFISAIEKSERGEYMRKPCDLKKNTKFLTRGIRFISFVAVLALMIYALNRTLIPKYMFSNTTEPTTSGFTGFYEMERNSIDVLFFGSSHMGSAVNPQDIYNESGIRSYNLASGGQPIWASYYLLREALNYQSPKVVVLDCYYLFSDVVQVADEENIRKLFINMKNGSVKTDAIMTAFSYNEEQTYLSNTFTNIRFHERWTELSEEDFTWLEEDVGKNAKGFFKRWYTCGDEAFTPLDCDYSEITPEELDADAVGYLLEMLTLCEEENIELILIKTPSYAETAERHVAIQNLADCYGLKFYDFNTKELYQTIGFDFATDMNDSSTGSTSNGHANISGARKMSVFLADELSGVNGLEPVVDSQWEDSKEFNEHCWQNFTLVNEEDLLTYLDLIDEDRYSIFISVKDDAANSLNNEIVAAMQNLGFEFNLSGCYRWSYLAVRDEGGITELLGEEELSDEGALRNGRETYFITSAGFSSGNESSIVIGGEERSLNSTGLNIVVYDNEMGLVIDSVCFNTYDPAWTATR